MDVLLPEQPLPHVEPMRGGMGLPRLQDGDDVGQLIAGVQLAADRESLVRIEAGSTLHIGGVAAQAPTRITLDAPMRS